MFHETNGFIVGGWIILGFWGVVAASLGACLCLGFLGMRKIVKLTIKLFRRDRNKFSIPPIYQAV